MIAEIAASAHCAHTLSRLAVDYLRMAREFPKHRARYAAESVRLRSEARWHLDRARRMKEAS